MHTLDRRDLAGLDGGSWLSDFGGGMCCGLAIGLAITTTAGAAIPAAIGTCLWALG